MDDQHAVAIVGGDAQLAVARQAGSAIGQRANRVEEDVEPVAADARRAKLVPVLVARQLERTSPSRVDGRITLGAVEILDLGRYEPIVTLAALLVMI